MTKMNTMTKMNLENKLLYSRYIDVEYDTYPETSQSYVISVFDNKDMLHRNFGPFETTEEAKEWFSDYYYNHTKKGFVSRYYINPLCEVK